MTEVIFQDAWERQGKSDAMNGFPRTSMSKIPGEAQHFYYCGYEKGLEEAQRRRDAKR